MKKNSVKVPSTVLSSRKRDCRLVSDTFTKFLIILVLLAVNFLNLTAFAFQEVPDDLNAQLKEIKKMIPATTPGNCKSVLVPAYDLETLKFLKFLEGNFENKSSASSLTNTAIAAYSEYKNTLRLMFFQLLPRPSVYGDEKTYETEVAAYDECREITGIYIAKAKDILIKHVRDNSAQKETTMLLEKLQSINSKLRDLNMKIAELYGLFMTFKNKLPGFLQECITS